MADWLLNFLTCIEFVAVDQALFTALELLKSEQRAHNFPVFERVWVSADAARKSTDLSLKKAWWLVLMALLPQIQDHVVGTASNRTKAQAYVGWLQTETEQLFCGKYAQTAKPLSEFVASAISAYCA